jgi:hypothetical protein
MERAKSDKGKMALSLIHQVHIADIFNSDVEIVHRFEAFKSLNEMRTLYESRFPAHDVEFRETGTKLAVSNETEYGFAVEGCVGGHLKIDAIFTDRTVDRYWFPSAARDDPKVYNSGTWELFRILFKRVLNDTDGGIGPGYRDTCRLEEERPLDLSPGMGGKLNF